MRTEWIRWPPASSSLEAGSAPCSGRVSRSGAIAMSMGTTPDTGSPTPPPGGNPNPNSVGIGGGVATFLSRVDVDRSSVSNNTSSEDGGGLWSRRDVSITRSTVADNTALGETLGALGGGLFLGSPSMTVPYQELDLQRQWCGRCGRNETFLWWGSLQSGQPHGPRGAPSPATTRPNRAAASLTGASSSSEEP